MTHHTYTFYSTVIVLDNRGIGESTVASENDPCSMDLMAQDTIALIEHLAIKKFNLLGWSMGGNSQNPALIE